MSELSWYIWSLAAGRQKITLDQKPKGGWYQSTLFSCCLCSTDERVEGYQCEKEDFQYLWWNHCILSALVYIFYLLIIVSGAQLYCWWPVAGYKLTVNWLESDYNYWISPASLLIFTGRRRDTKRFENHLSDFLLFINMKLLIRGTVIIKLLSNARHYTTTSHNTERELRFTVISGSRPGQDRTSGACFWRDASSAVVSSAR